MKNWQISGSLLATNFAEISLRASDNTGRRLSASALISVIVPFDVILETSYKFHHLIIYLDRDITQKPQFRARKFIYYVNLYAGIPYNCRELHSTIYTHTC